MDISVAWAVAGTAVVAIAGWGLFAFRSLTHPRGTPSALVTENNLGEVGEVLAALRSGAVVLDPADAVVQASPTAVALGLVRGQDLAHSELCQLARQVRHDGVAREVETVLPGTPGKEGLRVAARVIPLGRHHVLLLVEDRTQAQRLDAVRRDFVANVSHELKTPVGGIGLLAEAVLDAKDDPVAVERFARRISIESTRLSQLVQDIVDLSRLQASQTLLQPVVVAVSVIVRDAVDQVLTLAAAKQMNIVVAEDDEAQVFGDAELLRTAVLNLLTNAVNYSGSGTRVAVGVRRLRHLVEVTVSDQGQGIPASEQERIFERFYRVDPARSRATGGTGLGLAIVKHICSNHGGEVRVWSKVGQGSTFTMSLPAASVSRAAPTLPPTGDSVTAQALGEPHDAPQRGAVMPPMEPTTTPGATGMPASPTATSGSPTATPAATTPPAPLTPAGATTRSAASASTSPLAGPPRHSVRAQPTDPFAASDEDPTHVVPPAGPARESRRAASQER